MRAHMVLIKQTPSTLAGEAWEEGAGTAGECEP